jgi:hypothetical protein
VNARSPTVLLGGLALLVGGPACSPACNGPAEALAALAQHASGEWVLAPESRPTVPGAPAEVSQLSLQIDPASVQGGGLFSGCVTGTARLGFGGEPQDVTLSEAGVVEAEGFPTELQPDGSVAFGPAQPLGTEYTCRISFPAAPGQPPRTACLKWEPPVAGTPGAGFAPRHECLKLSFAEAKSSSTSHVCLPAEPCLVYVRRR